MLLLPKNFPQKYPSDSKCFYRIRVPQSFKIKIIFDEFDVEYDKKCRNDFMAITDKENQPWDCSFCQRLCGEKSEDIVIVKSDGTKEIMGKTNELVIDSNSVYVHLISDEEDEFQAFQIKYEAIYDPSVLNSSPKISESGNAEKIFLLVEFVHYMYRILFDDSKLTENTEEE